MFPVKHLSKSLLVFTLIINSFVLLSSPGFAGRFNSYLCGISKKIPLPRRGLDSLRDRYIFPNTPVRVGEYRRKIMMAMEDAKKDRLVNDADDSSYCEEMVDFDHRATEQTVESADETVFVSDKKNNWTNLGLSVGIPILNRTILGAGITCGIVGFAMPSTALAAMNLVTYPALASAGTFVMTKMAADAAVRKFVGESTQKAHPNYLSGLTSVLAGCFSAGAGNIIGALSSAMEYSLKVGGYGYEYGYAKTVMMTDEDEQNKGRPVHPVIESSSSIKTEEPFLNEKPFSSTLTAENIRHFVVCVGCSSVMTTANLKQHNCQKTDEADQDSISMEEEIVELTVYSTDTSSNEDLPFYTLTSVKQNNCQEADRIDQNSTLREHDIVTFRKSEAANRMIKLGGIPLENILLLKDYDGVFCICRLKEDNLNKINGCRTIKTSEGKPGIKFLEAKDIDLSRTKEAPIFLWKCL